MNKKPERNDYLAVINTALSAAVLVYAVNTEHRLTKMETELLNMLRERERAPRQSLTVAPCRGVIIRTAQPPTPYPSRP